MVNRSLTARGARQARMDSDLMEAVMDLKLLSLRTPRWLRSTRWGVAAVAAAAAAATCVPASSAQVVVGAGVPAAPGAVVVGTSSGFSAVSYTHLTLPTILRV